MSNQNNHLAVNWVDGMKLSKEHFIAQENYYNHALQHLAQLYLTDSNYGILPSFNGNNSLELQIDDVEVTLSKCTAITRNGARIELQTLLQKTLDNNLLQSSEICYLILKVNPFKRIPYGIPDPESSPVRNPFTIPHYSLEIITADAININEFTPNMILLAKYKGGVRQIKYIPPCSSIKSTPKLQEIHSTYLTQIRNISKNLDRIVETIVLKEQRSNTSTLAQDVKFFVLATAGFIHNNIDNFALNLPDKSPVCMIEWLIRLARTMSASLAHLKLKERMLSYFQKYAIGEDPIVYEKKLTNVCDIKYVHNDIRLALNVTGDFLMFFGDLFEKLKSFRFDDQGENDWHDGGIRVYDSNTSSQELPPISSSFSGGLMDNLED